jgi:hypothetical protein
MEQIFLILGKVFILSWCLTRFKPIQWLLDLAPDYLIFNLIRLLLTCLQCSSFWIGIIFTGDIFLASTASFIGFWWDKMVSPIENRIRLN